MVSGKDHLQKPCVDRTAQQMYNNQVLGVDNLGLNLDEATGDRYFVPGFHWYMEKKFVRKSGILECLTGGCMLVLAVSLLPGAE